MLKIKQTAQFKKDLKAAIRQHRDLTLLENVIDTLARRDALILSLARLGSHAKLFQT